MSRAHAYVIQADAESGIARAEKWIAQELGMSSKANPDVVILVYGLLSVEDARKISEVAASAPFEHPHKVLVICAHRAYHEAQNALLKLFEEPPEGTFLFLILPTLGGLLPTLRSRVQELPMDGGHRTSHISQIAEQFMRGGKEARSTLIKKLTSGKDEDEKRASREDAIHILNGIEAVLLRESIEKNAATLKEIVVFREYLYDRSAPVKMILEHLSLVVPKELS